MFSDTNSSNFVTCLTNTRVCVCARVHQEHFNKLESFSFAPFTRTHTQTFQHCVWNPIAKKANKPGRRRREVNSYSCHEFAHFIFHHVNTDTCSIQPFTLRPPTHPGYDMMTLRLFGFLPSSKHVITGIRCWWRERERERKNRTTRSTERWERERQGFKSNCPAGMGTFFLLLPLDLNGLLFWAKNMDLDGFRCWIFIEI